MTKPRRMPRWRFFKAPGVDMASQVAREGFEGAAAGVASLRPRRFNWRGFFGRDADGGIERYREYSDFLSSDQILAALYAWERDRGVFLVVCTALLAVVPISALYGVLTIPFGLGLIAGALFMGVKAAVADFRAWQIQQGRFGAPVEYANHRLPRNMQIMEKDHP